MSDPWGELDTLEAHVWNRLSHAAATSDDPIRIVALATAGPAGAQVRMVALRAASRAMRAVEVHTDLRTPKVGQVQDDPRAQILAWDPGARLQLRLSVRVEVIAGDPGRWSAVPEPARVNYGTIPPPGTPIPSPAAFDRAASIGRFAALRCHVREIDAVSLAHAPHRRAILRADGGGWVAP